MCTIQELEAGMVENPKLRNLVNIAAALGVRDFRTICEDEWLKPGKLAYYLSKTATGQPQEPVEPLKKQPDRFS